MSEQREGEAEGDIGVRDEEAGADLGVAVGRTTEYVLGDRPVAWGATQPCSHRHMQ
jgi:hypothetical protein